MNIIFLHLSDMHIANRHGINERQLRKIADALALYNNISKIILIISGDLTDKGTKEQFDFVYQAISIIIGQIKNRNIYSGNVDVLSVPGNHDLYMSDSNSLNNVLLYELKKDKHYPNEYDKHLLSEYEKLSNYFNYADRAKHSYGEEYCYACNIIDVDGFKIEINLINTAPFSIKEEDKGLHYLPQHCINTYGNHTGADFVVTVMHHPPEWFIEKT